MISYTRDDIKNKLRLYERWVEYDINECVNIIFSVRTCIRKILKEKPINDRLLVNNIIIISNIFGIEFSYALFTSICDDDEMLYVNSLYYFLKYKDCDPKHSFFIELLNNNCNMFTKS